MHQFSQFIKPIWMILMTESDFSSWFAWLLDLVTEVNSFLEGGGGGGWGYHWKNSHEAIIRLHKNVVHAAYRPILWCFYHAFSFNLSFSSSQMQLKEWPVQFKILLLCSTEERKYFRFWMTWEWVNYDRIFFYWLNYCFKPSIACFPPFVGFLVYLNSPPVWHIESWL